MLTQQSLDLDHSVPLELDPTSKGDRIVHASCNRGRRLGDTRRKPDAEPVRDPDNGPLL